MIRLLVIFIFVVIASKGFAQGSGFSIVENKTQKQVDILYNNKLLTAYCYYDSSRKPILFPVNTTDGVTVTRGFPFQLVAGERTDHPHHTGIWLNYESVNGLDFWNNSTAIAPEKRDRYGTIVHEKLLEKSATGNKALLVTSAKWLRPDGVALLQDETHYDFRVSGNTFIIDRSTRLTALDIPVLFKDVKDGFFAIRVARELEQVSNEPSSYVDDKGNITPVAASGNDVTGLYHSSTGLKGDSVWGTKGKWAMLKGKKKGREIAIGIIDHPANPGYPAYWHARGYGLFSINPLGRKIFSNGTEELNLSLQPGQNVTFRYRVIIHSGTSLSAGEMEKFSKEFERIK